MAQPSQVYSLFGLEDPRDVAAREYKQAFSYDPGSDPYAQAGAGFAKLGIGLARMFGGPSADVEKAQELESIAADYQPGNLQNMAETYTKLKEAGAPADTLNKLSADITAASEAFNVRQGEERVKRLMAPGLGGDPDAMRQSAKDLAAANYPEQAAKMLTLADQTEARQMRIQQMEETAQEKKERKAREARARKNAISFFKGRDGGEQYSSLIEMDILDPKGAFNAWQDAQDKGIDLTEIGPYTTPDGVEVIGAMDKKTGQILQSTPIGWVKVPDPTGWKQGRPRAEGEDTLKVGRTVGTKGQVYDIYNDNWDDLVDKGYFDRTGTKIAEVQRLTGITNLDDTQGKQELYSRAEAIRANNPGISEREALARALSGERVGTPQQPTAPTQTQDTNKPNLGAVSQAKKP